MRQICTSKSVKNLFAVFFMTLASFSLALGQNIYESMPLESLQYLRAELKKKHVVGSPNYEHVQKELDELDQIIRARGGQSPIPAPTSDTPAGDDAWMLGVWVLDNNGDIKVAGWAPHRGMSIEFRKENDGVNCYIKTLNSWAREAGYSAGQVILRRGSTNPEWPSVWHATAKAEIWEKDQWKSEALSVIWHKGSNYLVLHNLWGYRFVQGSGNNGQPPSAEVKEEPSGEVKEDPSSAVREQPRPTSSAPSAPKKAEKEKSRSNKFKWVGQNPSNWHQPSGGGMWLDEDGKEHPSGPGTDGKAEVSLPKGVVTLESESRIKILEAKGTLKVSSPLSMKAGHVTKLDQSAGVTVEDLLSISGRSDLRKGSLTTKALVVGAPVKQHAQHDLSASRVTLNEEGELDIGGSLNLSDDATVRNQGLVKISGPPRTIKLGNFDNEEVFEVGQGIDVKVEATPQFVRPYGALGRPLLEAKMIGSAIVGGVWDVAGRVSVRGSGKASEKDLVAIGRDAEVTIRGKGSFQNLGIDNRKPLVNAGSFVLRDKAHVGFGSYEQIGHGDLKIEKGAVLSVHVRTLDRFALFSVTGGRVKIDGELRVYDVDRQTFDDQSIRIPGPSLSGSGTINGKSVGSFGGTVTK